MDQTDLVTMMNTLSLSNNTKPISELEIGLLKIEINITYYIDGSIVQYIFALYVSGVTHAGISNCTNG